MKNLPISTLSKKKFLYNILDSIQVEVHTEENHYHIPIDALFLMAARINKKRSFLFVSKLIGKHLPVHPTKGLLASALLAARYYESVHGEKCEFIGEWVSALLMDEPRFTSQSFIPPSINPIVIGFAETATALGHAFFDCFDKADFFHTTREVLQEQKPVISFEEEHSHATSHRCFIPLELMDNDREIILVDDELTTGKTALNIIRSIQKHFPRKRYTIAAILDWRSEENINRFKQLEKSLGITIRVVSLISGSVQVRQQKEISASPRNTHHFIGKDPLIEEIQLPVQFTTIHSPSVLSNGWIHDCPYIEETGRFGLNSYTNKKNQQKWIEIASMLKEKRNGGKTLCLGTGEFMYIPMKIAAAMGQKVSYQSTTRSPIFIDKAPSYGIRYGLSFPNPEDMDISHYIYNIPPAEYEDIFIFFERKVTRDNLLPLLEKLKKTQIKKTVLVYFT